MRQDAELKKYDAEVASGERFEFGKNGVSFLKTIDEERIAEAKQSLMAMLGASDLEGKRFLDAGCGSGLLVLRLGSWAHPCIVSTTIQTPCGAPRN
jgi:2-polyprenyl-3-methyl-5-hydroxy-6-metoxy-1,4-benzoquinol methylase